MNALAGKVVIALIDGRIQIRDQKTWTVESAFTYPGALDLCWGAGGKLWITTDKTVTEVATDGKPTGRVISDAGRPSSVAVAPDGRLVICDDGERQQVRWYQVDQGAPKLLGTSGKKAASAPARLAWSPSTRSCARPGPILMRLETSISACAMTTFHPAQFRSQRRPALGTKLPPVLGGLGCQQ